jgi:hypothetical protein
VLDRVDAQGRRAGFSDQIFEFRRRSVTQERSEFGGPDFDVIEAGVLGCLEVSFEVGAHRRSAVECDPHFGPE